MTTPMHSSLQWSCDSLRMQGKVFKLGIVFGCRMQKPSRMWRAVMRLKQSLKRLWSTCGNQQSLLVLGASCLRYSSHFFPAGMLFAHFHSCGATKNVTTTFLSVVLNRAMCNGLRVCCWLDHLVLERHCLLRWNHTLFMTSLFYISLYV